MLWVLRVVFAKLKPSTKSNLNMIEARGAHQFLDTQGRHLKCVTYFRKYNTNRLGQPTEYTRNEPEVDKLNCFLYCPFPLTWGGPVRFEAKCALTTDRE